MIIIGGFGSDGLGSRSGGWSTGDAEEWVPLAVPQAAIAALTLDSCTDFWACWSACS